MTNEKAIKQMIVSVPFFDPATGKPAALEIPVEFLAAFYRTKEAVGAETAFRMLFLGATMLKGAALEEADADILVKGFRYLDTAGSVLWRNEKDGALMITYVLLQTGGGTRADAAALASAILGRKVEEEAWRKAVNKWAKEQGKPELKLPHGRPSTKKRDNG